MKYYIRLLLLFLMVTFCVFGTQSAYTKQKSSKTPPGQAKKQELPPGLAKKKELPPGLAKRQQIPDMQAKEEYKQAWCLEQQGKVNFVLSDKTICDCLMETYTVAFASEEDWTEALGRALYHAAAMEKEPGIVLFVEKNAEQPHVTRLDNVIKHFKLLLTVWTMEIEVEEQEESENN